MRLLRVMLIAIMVISCSSEVLDRRFGSALKSDTESDSSKGDSKKDDNPKPDADDDTADVPQWVNGVPLTCWYEAVESDEAIRMGCDASVEQSSLALVADTVTYIWSLSNRETRVVGVSKETSTAVAVLSGKASDLSNSDISVAISDGVHQKTQSAPLDGMPGGRPLLLCLRNTASSSQIEGCFQSHGIQLPSEKALLIATPVEPTPEPTPEPEVTEEATPTSSTMPPPTSSPTPSASMVPTPT